MKERPVVFLQGERLYLRPVERGDLERLRRWVNDPDVRQYILQQMPIDDIEEERWHETRPRGSSRTDIMFAIVLKKGNKHIGNMGIHGIDWMNRSATTGAVIGEQKYREKGYGSEAKELVLEYAFQNLGLHRISSAVVSTNPRSLAYLKKSGYREEGIVRERLFRNGVWINETTLSILDHEWRAMHKKE